MSKFEAWEKEICITDAHQAAGHISLFRKGLVSFSLEVKNSWQNYPAVTKSKTLLHIKVLWDRVWHPLCACTHDRLWLPLHGENLTHVPEPAQSGPSCMNWRVKTCTSTSPAWSPTVFFLPEACLSVSLAAFELSGCRKRSGSCRWLHTAWHRWLAAPWPSAIWPVGEVMQLSAMERNLRYQPSSSL